VCSLSWREPKTAKRPIIATVTFASPFEMLARPLTLKPSGRKPPDLGPKVRVEAVRSIPAAGETELMAIANGIGLRDWDKDGLKEHDTAPSSMWRGAATPDLRVEFELPEPVPLAAIEVWNFNAEWQTADGVRQADVAVSPDGSTWQTVLRGVPFPEAEGKADYDEPVRLQLDGTKARKVRFENLVSWGTNGMVGLSEVVFHQAAGPQAGPLQPEDGSTGVGVAQTALEWVAGQGAQEHRVLLGTAPNDLAPLGTTKQTRLDAPPLKPDTRYFWRVDELKPDSSTVTGRVASFSTAGLVAWWKLDETEGKTAADATGHQLRGNVVGQLAWAANQGRLGGAMEFDGKTTFINCGRAAEFDFRDSMTVSAWIKVREFDKPWQAIVTKGETAWRLERQKDTGTVTFVHNSGTQPQGSYKNAVRLIAKRKVDDGQWHHLVALSDGRRAALYVDGELEASADAQPIARNSDPVMIGCNSTAYERRFNGWIDDVRLYGYGLTEQEVKALYRGGAEK
jgi:hypothetical protein